MKWDEELLAECYKLINSEKGGEIHIIFRTRTYKAEEIKVPIINTYPDNQKICDEIKVKRIDK